MASSHDEGLSGWDAVGRLGDAANPMTAVRRRNLARVLSLVRSQGSLSRTALVDETGLNRATVIDLVSELRDRGLLEEGPALETGRKGRPPRHLRISGALWAVGMVELNRDTVSAHAATIRGEHLMTRSAALDRDLVRKPRRVLDTVAELLAGLRAGVRDSGRELGWVRIGLPAIVDRSAGIVLGATAFGWSRVLFRDELVQRLGDQVPYGLSLDRLAGHAIRAERDASDLPVSAGLVLLFGHAGIGGSFQQGGHTLQGDFDAGAQFGHITVDPDGRQCWCGRRGCLERYAGVGALANTLAGEPERQTLGPAIPVAATLERVATADDEVVAAVQGQAKWLARGLDIITAALGPSEIVFGGNLPHLMPFLENELAQHRSRLRPLGSGPMPRVRTSVLGVDAVARGGIARAIDDVLERPWMLSPDPLVADRRGVRQLTP